MAVQRLLDEAENIAVLRQICMPVSGKLSIFQESEIDPVEVDGHQRHIHE